ncbi:hypothetical protein [Dactylosporangium salmoneum]|uniref:hypothetical protein n=1 Tax=Dactylosporangium salmoneum TaxID=53361 RepID=UPI0031DFBDDF
MATNEEGISAGKVFVEVVPRSAGFWQRFVAENRAGAAAAGDDLGDRIGKVIADRIARGVRDGLGTGGGSVPRTQGTRLGNDFGGAYADAAKRRIEAALKSLPTPQIGVATTEAEQRLKDLRGELSTLSGKRIGVDIGVEEALAEARRLKVALDELAAKSPHAQVRVDAGQASIELAAIDRELARLDGRRANAKVDVDSTNALSGMNALISAGLALGPAIVPAAAAGAAAIAGLSVSALAAVPAVGVLALAFRGVSDAVKALGAAEAASAKTSSALVGQQRSLASSADQVRSAEASLANTRANAADSQRRSLQQIADAERSLTRAQQDAERAQTDLNDARETERRSQQDTALQLKQNVIDLRKAAIEIAHLQQAVAHGGGEQASLALEEALIRQEQLSASGERLAAEQARNQQTGIEGSRRVQDAQQSLVRSQEQVAAAERGITEARLQAASQARQSAFAIAQAQQAVVSAQRSAGAATAAAASTAGSALDKLNETMAGLPTSTQAFARYLFSLKPQLADLQKAAADGLLPGVQEGIQILLPYVGDTRTAIAGVSAELGSLARRSAETFTSPYWRSFFGFISSQATPSLEGLFKVSVNVAEGGAHMLQAFAPFERQVGGGLISVTKRFVEFSQNLDHNQAFQGFVRYALTEGPRVIQTIGAIVTAGAHIVQAYAPVGSVVVTELRLLSQVIDGIPLPVVTALASAITAYKTAALLTGGAQALLNSGLLQGIGRMITYRTVTDAAGVSTTGMQRALGAASGLMGGPFVAALSAVGIAIGYFVAKSQEAKSQIQDIKQAAGQYADILKGGLTPAAIEQANSLLKQNASLRGLVDATHDAGIATETLVHGLNGDKAARDEVVNTLNAQIQAEKIAAGEARRGSDAETVASQKHLDRADALTKMRDAFDASNAGNAEASRLTEELSAEQSAANRLFEDASPTVKKLADSYKIVADTASTAAQKTDALRDAEDALFGAARAADQAAEDQAKAIMAANKTLDDRNLLNEKGAKKLDMTSEAGLRVRDSLKDELNAINATYRANIANGMSVDAATKAHDAEVESLKKKWAQKGLDATATQKLIDIYGKVPTSATTDVTVTGLDATKEQLNELLIYQYALRNGITVGEARDKIDPLIRTGGGKGNARGGNLATGGPVVGPGTGTSDDVPAMERSTGAPFWLSNGEWVHRTAAVNYYGQGVMRAINEQRVPREAIAGYATGGLVGSILTDHYPFPTTTSMTRIPSRSEVAQIVLEGPSSGGSEDIKAFIRSTGSLPYVWATAGPHSYDCSGLASAVYGLVRGLGGGHGQRYFTTYDFASGAPAGFKPGPGGVLTVGVNPQSHMAGNYGGLGFEAASTRSGIKIGNRARKTSTFEKQFHLASGGLVSTAVLDELGLDIGGDPSGITVDGRRVPFGVYDTGGYLPTGLSLAYNGTGRPEVIRTEAQEQALAPAGNTWNIYAGPDQSVHELAKAVSAEVMWQGGL